MPHVEMRTFLSRLSSKSEMVKRIQNFDWSRTALGAIEEWPLSLQNAVVLMLSSGTPMFIAWGSDNTQLYNDAFLEIWRSSDVKFDFLGKSATCTWTDHWNVNVELWSKVKESGNALTHNRLRVIKKINEELIESFFTQSISPLRNDEFLVEGVFITCFEMTDQIQEERKLKEELESFQHKLQEYKEGVLVRDEFMSIASHELKTPLTALKLQTQTQRQLVLKQDPRGFDRDRIKRFSELVDEQVSRLNRMVDDMLEIGRVRRGKLSLSKEQVELGLLVRDSIESIKTHFCSQNFPRVETTGHFKGNWDPDKVKQIVTNILLNAIRFGGSRPICVRVEKEDEFAKLSIKDGGIEIPAENLERIFDRYERVAPKSGQEREHGLFLTKKMVEAHDGRIWVESVEGEGSTFHVLLPL